MSDFFNRDNAYNRFMIRAFDLCALNLVFFITCLPYFTIGASLTALYRVLFAVHEKRGGGVVKMYLSEFARNFGKSTLLFILPGLLLPLLLFNMYFWSNVPTPFAPAGYTATVVMLVMWACWMFWLFPLTARFENSNINTMKNAVKFALCFFPLTAVISVAGLLYCALLFYGRALWPLVPVLALLVMLYPQSIYVHRSFMRYERDREGARTDA